VIPAFNNTGIKLKLFYDKPLSNLNPKDAELYEKNIFSVTRQVHFSTQGEKSLDLVVFINGLPVITFELKNELTKQNVKDAIKQLESLGNEKMRAHNTKNGAGDNQFGVLLGDIRAVAKKIKTNHDLAPALWKTGNPHAQPPATLLLQPKNPLKGENSTLSSLLQK